MKTESQTPDATLGCIADYVATYRVTRQAAFSMARWCLLDSIACGLNALAYPECVKLLGPAVPGATLQKGSRVLGTDLCLEPVKAAFDISTTIRWLEQSDTWFGLDGGHPSDNLGAVIAVADYVSRRAVRASSGLKVKDVLAALIKAYEIHGALLQTADFIRSGLDSVGLVKVASSAVATQLLGGSRQQIFNAVSNAFLDGASPRAYRDGGGGSWRMKWAAGDAASRGVMHALMALRNEAGHPDPLRTAKWGFADALMQGRQIELKAPLETFVVENVYFKVPFPGHFHAQTASECAMRLHPLVKDRISDIKAITLRTHEKTLKSASREGPLRDPGSRDHCVQYIVAFVLLHGALTSRDYEDEAASDPRIDILRAKISIAEDSNFTRDFYDTDKRTNSNAIRVEFNDGSSTPEIRIDYPLGHPTRRKAALPFLEEKFRTSLGGIFSDARQRKIWNMCEDIRGLNEIPFKDFMAALTL